jgi:hypothetical protein
MLLPGNCMQVTLYCAPLLADLFLHSRTYFVIHDSDSTHKYFEVDIKEMLGFLIDIFVVFGSKIFLQQTVRIPMGTNCALCYRTYSYILMKQNSFKNFYIRRINLLLRPLIQHLDISTMFYRSTIISSIHMSILYTPMNLKLKTPQNHLLQLHTWTFC